LLRDAFTSHGGVEVEMQGDSFHFSFRSAREAAHAALAAQRSLSSFDWPTEPIRVRIGLHTGEPAVVEGLYAGLDVHRAARIMSAGHGGQVLISARTVESISAETPDGLATRDLGEHRLKDLPEPMWLFQLGDGEFPPLASLNNTNLPSAPSPLIGRRAEVDEITTTVRDGARLITLTGPGGTGKTRVAVAAASELVGDFRNGVFFVDLAPITAAELVPSAVARALGVREDAAQPLERTVAAYLQDRELLLVLDNFEHVLEAAGFLATLLAASPNLRALVTTREPLRIAGELERPLAPLPIGDSTLLFDERARAVDPSFALEECYPEVEAICSSLDRLPLAIELAAARVRLLPPARLLERLDERLPFLTGGRRDAHERQRTLRATIEWSHDLLEADERLAFAGLSVFAGGWTLEGAEAVGVADLSILGSLVEKSLVHTDGVRFGMLETIREYATERLRELPEQVALARRHTAYFADLAERTEPELRGPDQPLALAILEAEFDNMRVALARSIESGFTEGVRLAGYLVYYWYTHGHTREALLTLERLAPAAESATPRLRARLLDAHALFLSLSGSQERALELSAQALELARSAGDDATLGNALVIRQMVTGAADDQDGCADAARDGIVYGRRTGDTLTLAASLSNLAEYELEAGRISDAERLASESLDLFEGLDDSFNAAGVLRNLATIALVKGDVQQARNFLTRAAEAARDSGSNERHMWVLDGLTRLALIVGRPSLAAQLLGAADAIVRKHEIARFPVDEAHYRKHMRDIQAALSEDTFAQLYEEGGELTVVEAIQRGLAASPIGEKSVD
jgi:predicted ATPase